MKNVIRMFLVVTLAASAVPLLANADETDAAYTHENDADMSDSPASSATAADDTTDKTADGKAADDRMGAASGEPAATMAPRADPASDSQSPFWNGIWTDAG